MVITDSMGDCCPGASVIITVGGLAPPGAVPPPVPEPCEWAMPEDCCVLPDGSCSSGGCTDGPPNGPDGGPCRRLCQPPPPVSAFPIRYGTGEVILNVSDFEVTGYGTPWGHTRSFGSRMSVNESNGSGFNWQVREWPYLVRDFDGNVTVLGIAAAAIWFTKDGSDFVPTFQTKEVLTLDEVANVYRLTARDGTVTEFDSLTGVMERRIIPGGDVIQVTDLTDDGYNIAETQRNVDVGGQTVTERFNYTYENVTGSEQITRVAVTRKVGSGSWENIIRCNYTYYGFNASNGGYGDLETATTQTWDGSQWNDVGTNYYRYYLQLPGTASSSSSSSGRSSPTPVHLLKYVLGPEEFLRLTNDPSVTDPLTASDAIVSQYARTYFEYDSHRRVTKEIVFGGASTYSFAYEESSFENDYNHWKWKTTETRPDGLQFIVYSNYAARTMLTVLKDGTDEWLDFAKYDSNGHMILHASAAAISGYDEQYADLLHEQSGNYEYLRDSSGLIATLAYHQQSGYVASQKLQEGELGTPGNLNDYEYVACYVTQAGGGSSSSSSSGGAAVPTWVTSKKIEYPDASSSTTKIETAYVYTWYDNTYQVKQKTTTLPVISTAQNGSGTAATKEYFDEYGNLTWQMDERGFITRTKYDIPTGAVTQQIQDVDTSVETDAPAGWSTPSGGGLNLVTDFEHDDRGRITQSLGPSHTIDISGSATSVRRATWIVYDNTDDGKETRIGNGYATGSSGSYTYTLINPVSITKADLAGRTLEQIQATRASTSGKLMPTDTFAQSSYTRWTTVQYTDCCFESSRRVYHTIPTSGTGSSGTNYDETSYGYDVMKRRNRTVTPGGTITFNVIDVRGQVIGAWSGTDDTGATSTDPTGGGATGNNMVQVTGMQYDGGSDGGNGNLTQQTAYVDGSTTRITTMTYDWRDRRTETDGEEDFCEKLTYDNLDRVIKRERYDTTTSGNLAARSETKFDDRGRVYRTIRFAVDPSTGTVGNSLTDNTWFDAAGNAIKQLPAGSDLFTKTNYDSLGRVSKRYSGYDLDETGYPG
ncbi:MAG: hypothetical protein R3C59_10765 [Planctomycetaceae bacterium]